MRHYRHYHGHRSHETLAEILLMVFGYIWLFGGLIAITTFAMAGVFWLGRKAGL